MELIQGDCLEEMAKLPDNSIDMILTDAPYGTTACKWDSIIPIEPMWKQLKRVIKPNGAIVLFGSEPFSSHLRISNLNQFKYDWIWDKINGSNFLNAKKQPLRSSEIISVFYKKPTTYNPQLIDRLKKNIRDLRTIYGDGSSTVYGATKVDYMYNEGREIPLAKGYPKNIITINNKNNECHPSKILHPTQKPVALMEYMIRTYTNVGETVLDFTMGSGTTGVACKNLNRSFIGIELDKEYFEIAEKRIMTEPNQFDLF